MKKRMVLSQMNANSGCIGAWVLRKETTDAIRQTTDGDWEMESEKNTEFSNAEVRPQPDRRRTNGWLCRPKDMKNPSATESKKGQRMALPSNGYEIFCKKMGSRHEVSSWIRTKFFK
ncbi:MAG: hypothetical protein JJU29_08165 [Verrucomicrobia bacterium]|nr:hypothetical protein [Verrucomicrobiota bacterium]MCH8512086.1 hypothetical protein [Kiritimatiellia bacterium]